MACSDLAGSGLRHAQRIMALEIGLDRSGQGRAGADHRQRGQRMTDHPVRIDVVLLQRRQRIAVGMLDEIKRPDDIVEEPPLLGSAQGDDEVGGLSDGTRLDAGDHRPLAQADGLTYATQMAAFNKSRSSHQRRCRS